MSPKYDKSLYLAALSLRVEVAKTKNRSLDILPRKYIIFLLLLKMFFLQPIRAEFTYVVMQSSQHTQTLVMVATSMPAILT